MRFLRSSTAAPPDATATSILAARDIDESRERTRQRRLSRVAVTLGLMLVWLTWRALTGNPLNLFSLEAPHWDIDPMVATAVLFFVALLALMVGTTLGTARSPTPCSGPSRSRSPSTTSSAPTW